MKPEINKPYLLEKLQEIVSIPSPTGFCGGVIDHCEKLAQGLGYSFARNQKGNGLIEVEGEDNSYGVAVFVHVDTLGAMVRSINGDGTLRVSTLGGNMFATLDGEYCAIHTRAGKIYTGTVLSTSPAVHVFKDAHTAERCEDTVMVRLDELVFSKADTEALGIETGDFICIDPKFQVTPSGFVKSRYLDDKGSTACIFAILEHWKRTGTKPKHRTLFVLSTYEETGHGGSNIPAWANEAIAFDMGCVGLDLAGHETKVSICPKDSGGPYDYGMTGRLIEIAKELELQYAVDIFPMYGSDAGAALRAGWDIKAALVGPGVGASHGMERTHIDGLVNATQLVLAYLG